MPRKLPSFIEGFKALVRPKGPPEEFATWTALWCLSATIERRVWTFTRGEALHPNIFTFLVSPPGFGKGLTLNPAKRIVAQLGKNWLSASSMSYASLVDGLRAGQRSIIDKASQRTVEYYAMNVLNTELQVLLPQHDTITLGKLTDIYDCGEYSETRRKDDASFALQRTCITMLGGTTPEHIFSTFPESAFRTGFFSRVVLVWGGNIGKPQDLFDENLLEEQMDKTERELLLVLKEIRKLSGKFSWEPAAADLIRTFNKQNYPYGGDPVPSYPRLLHYCTRRTQHMIKLMMLYSIDQSDSLVITGTNYEQAYETLIATESLMPEIFQDQAQGGEAQIVDELHHQLVVIYTKTKKPVPKAIVYQLLGKRLQAFKIDALINMAVTGGWLKRTTDPKLGACFIPISKTPSETEWKMK